MRKSIGAWTLAKAVGLVPVASWRMALARKFFKDFHDQFGGHMRMLVTGMAPIRREMGTFFERMQLPLCESYGMVEAGSITCRAAGQREYSSVGKVLPGVRLTFENDGEIVVHRDHPHDPALFPGRRRRERTHLRRPWPHRHRRYRPHG